jgi:MSHA biogenesis protein MshJ
MKRAALSLTGLVDKVDRLSLRERAILLALGVALVWALADGLLRAPVASQLKAVAQQTGSAQRRIEAADQALAELARRADPDAGPRQRLAAVRQEYQTRLAATAALRASLVPAREMPALLESLVARHPGLRLVALKSLPPEPVAGGGLYRHGVELELEGGYAQLVGFLQRAERMPRRPFWDRAELDASHHPAVRLKLRLYTLSQEEAWLAL